MGMPRTTLVVSLVHGAWRRCAGCAPLVWVRAAHRRLGCARRRLTAAGFDIVEAADAGGCPRDRPGREPRSNGIAQGDHGRHASRVETWSLADLGLTGKTAWRRRSPRSLKCSSRRPSADRADRERERRRGGDPHRPTSWRLERSDEQRDRLPRRFADGSSSRSALELAAAPRAGGQGRGGGARLRAGSGRRSRPRGGGGDARHHARG